MTGVDPSQNLLNRLVKGAATSGVSIEAVMGRLEDAITDRGDGRDPPMRVSRYGAGLSRGGTSRHGTCCCRFAAGLSLRNQMGATCVKTAMTLRARQSIHVLAAAAAVASALAGTVALSRPTAAAVVPASAMTATRSAADGSGTVTAADIAWVQAAAYELTTTNGVHVQVVHVSGVAVMATLLAGVWSQETDSYKDHDMLVVRATDHPVQILREGPGDRIPPTVLVCVIMDATDGHIINRGAAPAGHDDYCDLSQFGGVSDVVIA